jgi:protein gp37
MLPRSGGIGGLGGLASEPGSYSTESVPARVTTPAWYDATWNPTAGCSPIGSGCDHCEALRTVAQLARIGGKVGARYAGLTVVGRAGAQWSGEIRVRDDVLTWPLVQRKGRRILVDSLSDPFHEKLATEAIDAIHAVMAIAHWHRFLLLTRRAERLRAYYADPQTQQRIAAQIQLMAATVLPRLGSSRAPGIAANAGHGSAVDVSRDWTAALAPGACPEAAPGSGEAGAAALGPWPLPNLWLGVSVENQDRAGRIGELLQTLATLRWVCFEPLLGPVRPDLVPLGADDYVDALGGSRFGLDGRGRRLAAAGPALRPLDWIVAGGETGNGARPADLDWVRDLRDRCAAAGVPFFFRHWGEWAPASEDQAAPKMLRRGHRAAGRLIDGRSWDKLPPAIWEPGRRPR